MPHPSRKSFSSCQWIWRFPTARIFFCFLFSTPCTNVFFLLTNLFTTVTLSSMNIHFIFTFTSTNVSLVTFCLSAPCTSTLTHLLTYLIIIYIIPNSAMQKLSMTLSNVSGWSHEAHTLLSERQKFSNWLYVQLEREKDKRPNIVAKIQ